MFAAVLDSMAGSCSLSGTLDATAVAGVSTSSTVTVTVPSGNSGDIRFEDYVDVGTITTSQTSKNAGAFTSAADPTTVTFANADTLAFRTNSNGAGESRTFTLIDVTTGNTIGTYVHTGA
tara:strand:- start:6976 stop:7335 length:360 start_codon:yes stop_codon:yes gene_type:complete